MKLTKKLLISIIFIIAFIAIPSISKAELTDAQRQALVNVTQAIVEEGNRKRILRYSQDHRTSGFNWTKVSNHNKQATVGTIAMYPAELARVTAALKASTGNKYAQSFTLEYSCKILGADVNDTISFDCSSLCSAVYNMTFGTSFGSWPWVSSQFGQSSSYFDVTSDMSKVEPGDILWKSGHVAIYLGDIDNDGIAEIAEASGFCSYKNTNAALSTALANFLCANPTYIKEHPQRSSSKSLQPTIELPAELIRDATKQVVINHYKEGRFKKVAKYKGPIGEGRAINLANITTTNTGGGTGDDSSTGGALTVDAVNNEAVILPWGTAYQRFWPEGLDISDETLKNSEGYFHKGIPTYGAYIGRVEPYNWFIDLPQSIFNWMISAINMVIQSQIVGWASIAEDLISDILQFGTEPVEVVTTVGSTQGISALNINTETSTKASTTSNYEDDGKVTIEDILYNRVPLLDINFFNFSKAGGQDLNPSSLIYTLRENIAGWYYTIRNIAIAGMLIALLYIAIRIAISAPGEKAEYKAKLKDWLIAFVILFLLHYFMIAVINLNNSFVEILDPANKISSQEESVFENIRIMAYDFSPLTGITGAILFAAMILYLVRFVILYVKRLLVLALLTVISPLVAVKGAFSKKQTDLKKWAKEYTYNVLIQFVHALVYTIFASIAFELAKTATIRGTIFSMLTLGLLFTAEKIIKRVLNFNTSESIGGLENSTLGQLVAMQSMVTMGKLAGQTTKSEKARNLIKTTSQKSNETIHKLSQMTSSTYESAKQHLAASVPDSVKNSKIADAIRSTQKYGQEIIDDYKKGYNEEMAERHYKTFTNIEDKIKQQKEQEKSARRAYARQAGKFVINAVVGTGATLAIFPVLIVNPNAAQYVGIIGLTNLFGAYGKRNISRPKKAQTKTKYTSPKLRFAWATMTVAGNVATLGMVSGIKNAKEGFDDMSAHIKEDIPANIEKLEKARELEDKILTQLEEIYGPAVRMDAKTELNSMATRNMINDSEKTREDYMQRTTNVSDDKLREQVQQINSRDFEQALNATLNEVTEKDVQDGIVEYLIENDLTEIQEKDIEPVVNKINDVLKRKKKDISLSTKYSDNLREELRRRVDDLGLTDKSKSNGDDSRPINIREPNTGNKTNKTEQEEREETVKTPKDLHMEDKTNKINESLEDKRKQAKSQDIKNAVSEYLLTVDVSDETKIDRDKAVEKIREALNKKRENIATESILDSDIRKEFNNRVREKKVQEEKVEEIMPKLNVNDLVEVFSSVVNKENSVDRTIRQSNLTDLMKDIKSLDTLNKEYKETNENPIYKDVKSLVKNLRNSLGTN